MKKAIIWLNNAADRNPDAVFMPLLVLSLCGFTSLVYLVCKVF